MVYWFVCVEIRLLFVVVCMLGTSFVVPCDFGFGDLLVLLVCYLLIWLGVWFVAFVLLFYGLIELLCLGICACYCGCNYLIFVVFLCGLFVVFEFVLRVLVVLTVFVIWCCIAYVAV